jgi:hypothetical protein
MCYLIIHIFLAVKKDSTGNEPNECVECVSCKIPPSICPAELDRVFTQAL